MTTTNDINELREIRTALGRLVDTYLYGLKSEPEPEPEPEPWSASDTGIIVRALREYAESLIVRSHALEGSDSMRSHALQGSDSMLESLYNTLQEAYRARSIADELSS